MIRSSDDRDLIAGEYVLGVLDAAEMAHAEELLASDRSFSQEVRFWRERLAPLDATAAPLAARPALWQRIEAATSAKPAAGVYADSARASVRHLLPSAESLWNSIGFWRWSAMAGAVASIALLLMAGALLQDVRQPGAEISMVAVLAADNGRPGAVVHAYADGSVRLIPLADIPVPEGRALQVWTLRDRQEGPISVGLLDKARSVKLDLGSLPAPRADQLFEITLEPETGSPTGRPTGPILMKGLAAGTL
jgi:anti-sigma-K factor RskA